VRDFVDESRRVSPVELSEAAQQKSEFRGAAAAWLAKSVPEEWRSNRGALSEDDETRLRSLWDRLLFEGGYAGLSLPQEYGGRGLSLEEEVIFHELSAREQAPDGLGRIGKILTAPTLITHGSEYQKATYLPKIFSGEHVWCQGFSEPGAGSDLASVKTQARKVDGGYVINGTKTWTSFSKHAHRCLLLAETDSSAGRYKNLSLFLVDMKQSTVTIDPIKQISGSEHFSETHFDNTFVADEDLVGAEGEGWRVAMTILENERGIVEAITRYVEIRADIDQLETCCVSDPHTMDRVRELDARAEVMKWQVAKSVAVQDDPREFARASMVLKVWWSELWQQVTSLAASVDCEQHRSHWRHQYLESRSASIYSGTNEIQRNIIAERVLRLPK